jgi:hypothetical protein
MEAHPELEQELFLQARTDALRAERSAITDAMQHDVISEAVHEELVHAADNRMAALDLIRESRRPRSSTPETSPATEKDVEDNHE